MVDPLREKPLPSYSLCSDKFWEEDSSGIPASSLFHFTADIEGSHAAITLDKCSRYDLVSIEVVENLQLVPTKLKQPFMLTTNDDALHITLAVSVPLTINGHTERIYCYVIPRALLVVILC